MESLKSIHELCTADVRQGFFAMYDHAVKDFRKPELQDIYDQLQKINLHVGVPEKIRSHFATALNLVAYSWFYYPFNVAAELMGHITVEFALRTKYSVKENVPFKRLVERAVKDGLIRESKFSHYVQPNIEYLPDEIRQAIVQHPESEYLQALIESIPGIRNTLAHGASSMHNSGLGAVRFCADFINQLFELPEAT